jgi:aminoglycoside/choline kinase family phosphotransferase
VKLRLSYAGDRGGLPDTVFCKIAPFDASQRVFLRHTGIGVMEARLYVALAAELPVRVPGLWHASVDDKGGFIMVLEDLDASGCTFPRPADADIEERAMSTVQELGHLHARYWEAPRFSEDLDWVPERAGFGAGGGKDKAAFAAAGRFMDLVLDRFGDEMPPTFRAVAILFRDRAADILDLWDEGERTLIHGDPHSGNLFTDHGRTGFFDWAMFSRSPGMRDVAYYCCNSIPTDVRRSIQPELLDQYRRTLGEHGIAFDPLVMERQYRLFAVVSWMAAATTAAMGDRWQPTDRALAAMERTTTALEDVDSVGLLRELLA